MADTLAQRLCIGVLVPWFNSVVQPELETLRPADVTNQCARFAIDASVVQNIVDASVQLQSCGIDSLVVGLSTESFPGGAALLEQGRAALAEATGLPVFSAPSATQAALRALGAKRVALLTPFDEAGNAHVRDAFAAEGVEVSAAHGLACPDFAAIARVPLDQICAGVRAADSDDAEAIVQVGTGLPMLPVLDTLEQELSKPIVACNAAAYWQTLRECGVGDPIPGCGRLFAAH